MKLRSWGADFKDVKDCVKAFKKFDDNDGGFMLFDEFIEFATEFHLDIEKDTVIIKNAK